MKLVILDCDGTLVDSQNGICAAMDHAFGTHGLNPPARAATLAIVGLSLPEAFAALAPEHGDEIRARLIETYKQAFVEVKRIPALHEPLFDGIAAAIEHLSGRDDVLLGIATGTSRRGIDRLFAREDWAHRFHTVQTADNHPSKPHPAMILAAMADAGAEPRETLMIGDTTFDMEMARAAGVGALGVAWGYHRADTLAAAGAYAVVQRGAELAGAVDAFFARRERAA
jgi:phosphoglycolate phosphatase